MKSQSREARLNNESSKSQFCGMKGRKSHFLYIISVVSMDEKAKMTKNSLENFSSSWLFDRVKKPR
jgi:hypothetical protein